MTGLAWLMSAEERNRDIEGKQLILAADDASGTPNGSARMEPPPTPLSAMSSTASSPSPTVFRPFADPADRAAKTVRDLIANSPASPDTSRALGAVRMDSSSSVDSTTISSANAVTPKQVHSLMDQSKKVISHLKQLSDEEQNLELMDPNGSLPTYENLVTRLVDKFRNQREVNSVGLLTVRNRAEVVSDPESLQANARLFSLSYVVQMHNYARTRQVMKEVAQGKRQIVNLQGNVRELEQNVEDISVDLEEQKAQAEAFKQNLTNTRNLLDKVMVDYRDELNRQREVLRRQQRYLGSMYSAKLSQDLALDIFICIFGVYIVSHPFIRHPLNFLGTSFNQLVPLLLQRNESVGTQRAAAEQRGIFIQRLVRIVAFVALVRQARDLAMNYGLHNRVGVAFSYFTYLTDNVRNRLFGAEDLVPGTTDNLLEEGHYKMLEYSAAQPVEGAPGGRRMIEG